MNRSATFELAAGPALFMIGVAIMYSLPELGPLDRAKVQGLIGLPLLAAAPGFAGLAGRATDARQQARRVLLATAAAIGILATWATATSVTFARCRPVTNPLDALPEALIVGLLAATSYGFAGSVALGSAVRGRRWLALAEGAGLFVGLAGASVLVIFTALFPVVSCAPPR